MQHLIVVRPFGSWRIGDVVTEQPAMDRILASDHSNHVVRVTLPEEN